MELPLDLIYTIKNKINSKQTLIIREVSCKMFEQKILHDIDSLVQINENAITKLIFLVTIYQILQKMKKYYR